MKKLSGIIIVLVFLFAGVQVCSADLSTDTNGLDTQQKFKKMQNLDGAPSLKAPKMRRERMQNLQNRHQQLRTHLQERDKDLPVPANFKNFSVNGSERVKEGRVEQIRKLHQNRLDVQKVSGDNKIHVINNDLTGVEAKRAKFSENTWRSQIRQKLESLFTRRQNLQEQRQAGQAGSVLKFDRQQASSFGTQQKVYNQTPALTNTGNIPTKIQGISTRIDMNR